MKRLIVLVVVVMLVFGSFGAVVAQDDEPIVPSVEVTYVPTAIPTVQIVTSNQVLPPNEAVPAEVVVSLSDLQAQGLFVEGSEVDYTTIMSFVIVGLGLLVGVFGGMLYLQGRQLMDSVPPWLKEILITSGDVGLRRLDTITQDTATPIDDVALREILTWWAGFTLADREALLNLKDKLAGVEND